MSLLLLLLMLLLSVFFCADTQSIFILFHIKLVRWNFLGWHDQQWRIQGELSLKHSSVWLEVLTRALSSLMNYRKLWDWPASERNTVNSHKWVGYFSSFLIVVWDYNFTEFVWWARPRATNENKKWAFDGSSLLSGDFCLFVFFLCATSLVKSGLVWPRPRHNRTGDLTLALLCLISTMLIKLESFAYSQRRRFTKKARRKKS